MTRQIQIELSLPPQPDAKRQFQQFKVARAIARRGHCTAIIRAADCPGLPERDRYCWHGARTRIEAPLGIIILILRLVHVFRNLTIEIKNMVIG